MILARAAGPAVALPATFSWHLPWSLVLFIGSGCALSVAFGLKAWLERGDPHGILLAGILPSIALLNVLSERRRTVITADRVSCWRGFRRREIRWCDVAAVALETRSGEWMEVGVRLPDGRVEHILPTGGDVIGVLVTARRAHAAAVTP